MPNRKQIVTGDDGESSHPSMSTATASERLQEIFKETADDQPQVFSEMQELLAGKWIEAARWVRYEEEADIDGARWSTPHVATFDGKALGVLQHLFSHGIFLFHSNFENVGTIAKLVADAAVDSKKLPADNHRNMVETISAQHYHFHQLFEGHVLNSMFKTEAPVTSQLLGVKRDPQPETSVKPSKMLNKAFARKLEDNAEGASILIGAVDFLTKPLFVFMRQSTATPGVRVPELTEVDIPLRFVVMILGPLERVPLMKSAGRLMASALSDSVFERIARTANSVADLQYGLINFGDFATVLAPGQWDNHVRIAPPSQVSPQAERQKALNYDALLDTETESQFVEVLTTDPYEVHLPPGLQVTGRPFGGLVADIKRKAPHYLSDFKDGIAVQCVAAILFLFWIILTQMVSFGGLMGEYTENNIGAFESIVSAGVNGIIYHLFAGQPLTVISSTGPVAVFEALNFQICKSFGLKFLEFRFWVGMWTATFLLLVVMFDLSFIVCFITRFTEDNFAALIASIFIYEAIKYMTKIYKEAPVNFPSLHYTRCDCRWANETYGNGTWIDPKDTTYTPTLINATSTTLLPCDQFGGSDCKEAEHCTAFGEACNTKPDVFFFSLLLFIATFLLATFLKEFRQQPFFPNRVRVSISDFAVSFTVFAMVAVDYFCGFDTVKLNVPKKFEPTLPGRGWLVKPIDQNPLWSIFAAAGPGLIATVLLFMDHQITTVIVNRKDNLLKKGFGYHLDLLLVAIQVILCSIFGITWLVAATVLAIGHLNSLRLEAKSAAPGEPRKFLGIREQRVTGIVIFSLILCSIFATEILGKIPMAVLYGCFLYMGIQVLKGCGNFQRLLLVFMPNKYQPNYGYLRNVRTWRIHLFTAIQILSFIVLWALKETPPPYSMAFPLMLVVMVFIRKGLDRVFTNKELYYLDDIMPPFQIPRVAKTPARADDSKGEDGKESTTLEDEEKPHLNIQFSNEDTIAAIPSTERQPPKTAKNHISD